jgi:kynurenine formamidase
MEQTNRWRRRPEGSNWGDFGPDDQIGRMNLITKERRLAAVQEVKEGIAFCLSLPLDLPGGAGFTERRVAPILHPVGEPGEYAYNARASLRDPNVKSVGCDDWVVMYNQFSTQWDAFPHHGQEFDADGDGVDEVCYYNGYRGGDDVIGPERGPPKAEALGIENLAKAAVQGRGVMINAFSTYGRERVRLGYDEIMRLMEKQGAEVRTGDILCLYTGLADYILEQGHTFDREATIGTCSVINSRDKRLLNWISDSGIAAICADNIAVEWMLRTLREDEHVRLPLHELCLFKQGIHIGELWYFGELAPWLEAHNRTAFLLTAPPLRLPGAVGSPVTPVGTV